MPTTAFPSMMGPNPLSSAIFDPPIQLVYPLNTCHYLPILLVLIHASVLITMFYPIVYPFCSFFSIFFGIVVPMFLGLLNVPPIRFIYFCRIQWRIQRTATRKDIFEEELRAATLRLAEGIRRNTSGAKGRTKVKSIGEEFCVGQCGYNPGYLYIYIQ